MFSTTTPRDEPFASRPSADTHVSFSFHARILCVFFPQPNSREWRARTNPPQMSCRWRTGCLRSIRKLHIYKYTYMYPPGRKPADLKTLERRILDRTHVRDVQWQIRQLDRRNGVFYCISSRHIIRFNTLKCVWCDRGR